MKSINELLNIAIEHKATDLHLVAGKPPVFRIHGDLIYSDLPTVHADSLKAALYAIINDRQRNIFETKRELDFAYNCSTEYQFRVNAHFEKGNIASFSASGGSMWRSSGMWF